MARCKKALASATSTRCESPSPCYSTRSLFFSVRSHFTPRFSYQLCAGADASFKSKYGVLDAGSHECVGACCRVMCRVTGRQVHQMQCLDGAEHGRCVGVAPAAEKLRDFVLRRGRARRFCQVRRGHRATHLIQ